MLILEAMLVGSAASATENKDDDPLTEAAFLYKVDTKALRSAGVKAEKEKTRTRCDHVMIARLVVELFGVDEFYNPNRLQGLCHECHSRKTAIEVGFREKKETQ